MMMTEAQRPRLRYLVPGLALFAAAATFVTAQASTSADAATGAPYVSLTAHARQVMQPNAYTLLKFDGEPSDSLNWHAPNSTVIVPKATGVASVCYKVTLEDNPGPQQYYVQILRDPAGAPDATGAIDRPNTPGLDYEARCWDMVVRANQPLGIRVRHDGPAPTAVTFAEFKVWMPS